MAKFIHATGICEDDYGLSYDCDMWLNAENIFSIGKHESGNIVATIQNNNSSNIYIIDGQSAEAHEILGQMFPKQPDSAERS